MKRTQFRAWDTAGWCAWHIGSALHDLGLWLCGVAGYLDARADEHR
jgi:hypothetical protein